MYIDKVSSIPTLPNQSIGTQQQTQNASPISNTYKINSPIQSVNTNNLLGSQQIGNNPTNFNLVTPYNSNQIHNNIYQPGMYNNPQYSQPFYPNKNNSNNGSNQFQQQSNYSYPNNYTQSVYYNKNISQPQQNIQVFSQPKSQFPTINYPSHFQNSIQHPNHLGNMQSQPSENVKNYSNSQYYYKSGYFNHPSSY